MAVEAKVGELNQAHGMQMSVSTFVDCLDVAMPLVEAFERMEQHYAAKAAGYAKAAMEAAEAQRRDAESHQATGADQPDPILGTIPFVGVDPAKPGSEKSVETPPPPSDEGADKVLTVSALVPAGQVDAVKGILRRLFAYCADVKISIE